VLKKALKETILFIFDIGLILYYLLVCCFFDFLIEIFMGTRIAKLISFIQKNIDWLIQDIGVFIIEKLEKRNMWY